MVGSGVIAPRAIVADMPSTDGEQALSGLGVAAGHPDGASEGGAGI